MANIDNMPRLALKRAYQDIITDELGLFLNEEQHKVGVSDSVVCWLIGMSETFERVRQGSAIKGELIIEFQVFSQINETGVHAAIRDLILISPTNKRLIETGVNIIDISPVASSTEYEDDSSDGMVSGTLSLKITYLTRF